MTPVSNVGLCFLLVFRGWSGRLQWMTLWTALAVAADALFWSLHATHHSLYAPLRIFAQYWLFNILMGLVIFEAWRVGVKWLEYLVGIQLAMSFVALYAHLHGDRWAVYYIECFNVTFNLLGIWYCAYRFRGENRYEPRT